MALNDDVVATTNGDLLSPANGVRTASVTANPFKKLIVCCDGTWVDRDNKAGVPTNITRLARAMTNEDEKHYQQIVYYQAGVGTGLGILNSIGGGGFGLGLAEHIREAYSFLANNYSELKEGALPDLIFLIGFSRGAFTARSIGGLLGAIGLLKKDAMPFFLDIFDDWQNAGRSRPRFFERYFENPADRKKYEPPAELALKQSPEDIDVYMKAYRQSLLDCGLTQEVKIKCIGVFDTVGSLGVPIHPFVQRLLPFLPAYLRPYGWFDTRIGDHVEHGFHALALDENRSPFHPTLWELKDEDKSYIKQVWFPGSHSNVGGGYDDTGIADITMTWMMEHLSGRKGAPDRDLSPEYWIQFDQDYIESYYEKRRRRYLRQLQEHKVDRPWPEWALGKIHDSFTFPYILAGRRRRTPGRYLFTDHVTGREVKGKLLTRTNESIHACVRERIHKGGLAPEPRWKPFPLNIVTLIKRAYYALRGRLTGGRLWPLYKPMRRGQPLQDWKLEDGHPSHERLYCNAEVETDEVVYWKYVGTKPGPQKITEDEIGNMQRKLLDMDSHPDTVTVDKQGWMDSLTTRARRGFQRPSTF